MKRTLKITAMVLTLVSLPAWNGVRAAQQFGPGEVPEACARAAAPRALQTFRWLVCAPERRAQWAASQRPATDLAAPPRMAQQIPSSARAIDRTPPRRDYLVRTTYGEFRRTQMSARAAQKPVQMTQLRREVTARGGAAQLMDFTD